MTRTRPPHIRTCIYVCTWHVCLYVHVYIYVHTHTHTHTHTSYRVFCVMGDGESAEGSIWEAASFAGYYKLDNLVAILDINR